MDNSLLLATQLVEEEPVAAVALLAEKSPESLAEFLSKLTTAQRRTVLENMPSRSSAGCLEVLPFEEGVKWLLDLRYPFRSRVSRALKNETLAELLKLAPRTVARQIQKDIAYARDRVGAWMEEATSVVKEDEIIAEVLARFRRMRRPSESTLIVVGDGNLYRGVLPSNLLLSGSDKRKIGDLGDSSVRPLKPDYSIPEVQFRQDWNTYLLLPVTGTKNRLLGVLKLERLKFALEQNTVERLSSGGMLANLLEASLVTVVGIGTLMQNNNQGRPVE